MSKFRLILFTVFRAIVFIVIPISLILAVNMNYPGLLSDKYLAEIIMATIIGVPVVFFYFLTDISEGKKKILYETIALTLVLAYTLLILGFGNAVFYYNKLKIFIYYLPLLALILIGIIVRYPVAILRYLAGE